jgi:hypothetical protein
MQPNITTTLLDFIRSAPTYDYHQENYVTPMKPITKPSHTYIFCLMQDEHLHQHCLFYNANCHHLENSMLDWRSSGLEQYQNIYLLILHSHFSPDKLKDWHKGWLDSFDSWIKSFYPLCGICNIPCFAQYCWNNTSPPLPTVEMLAIL